MENKTPNKPKISYSAKRLRYAALQRQQNPKNRMAKGIKCKAPEDKPNIDLSLKALQARRELAEKATPGPWYSYYEPTGNMIEGPFCEWVMGLSTNQGDCPYLVGVNEGNVELALEAYPCPLNVKISESDLEFIAANSPDAVIAMIDEIERLRAENHALKMEVQRLQIYEDDLK